MYKAERFHFRVVPLFTRVLFQLTRIKSDSCHSNSFGTRPGDEVVRRAAICRGEGPGDDIVQESWKI